MPFIAILAHHLTLFCQIIPHSLSLALAIVCVGEPIRQATSLRPRNGGKDVDIDALKFSSMFIQDLPRNNQVIYETKSTSSPIKPIRTHSTKAVKWKTPPTLFLSPNGRSATVALYRIKAASKVPLSSLQVPEMHRGGALRRSRLVINSVDHFTPSKHIGKEESDVILTKRGNTPEPTKEESIMNNYMNSDLHYKDTQLYHALRRAMLQSRPGLAIDKERHLLSTVQANPNSGRDEWNPSQDPIWDGSSPPAWIGSRAPGDALSRQEVKRLGTEYNGEWEHLHSKAIPIIGHASLHDKIGTNLGPVQVMLALRPSETSSQKESPSKYDRERIIVK